MIDWTRRDLLKVAAATGCCGVMSGCKFPDPTPPRGQVDVGAPTDYPKDGAYDRLAKTWGIIIIRKGPELMALSAVCTHEKCIVQPVPEGFRCPCHNSGYNDSGGVIRGPSIRPLDRFPITLNSGGHLIVDSTKPADDPQNPGDGFIVKL